MKSKHVDSKYNKNKDRLISISKQTDASLLKDLNLLNFGDGKSHKKRVKKFGLNNIKGEKFNFFKNFFSTLIQPFNIVLMGIAFADILIYLIYEKTSDHIVSAFISFLLLSITISVNIIQKYKSIKINNELSKMRQNKFLLLTENIGDNFEEGIAQIEQNFDYVYKDKITIGDVIFLQSGDTVPCDVRIIWSNNLNVNDSFIRGEFKRVNKSVEYSSSDEVYDLENILLSQSTIVEGTVLGVVISLGEKNYSHQFTKKISSDIKNNYYNSGMKKITIAVLLSVLIVFPLFFLSVYYSALERNFTTLISSLIFAITIVIALTPESFPAILAFNLQYGANKLKKRKLVVKNFESIQNLGATDIIITNKHGTVTKEKLILGDIKSTSTQEFLEKLIYLHTNFLDINLFGNKKEFLEKLDNHSPIIKNFNLIKFNNPNTIRKFGTVLLKNNDDGLLKQISKGICKVLIQKCSFIRDGKKVRALTEDDIFDIEKQISIIEQNGDRVLGVSTKLTSSDDIEEFDMIYEGFVTLKVELKPGINKIIKDIYDQNLEYILISGESIESTKNIAKEIGVRDIQYLSGNDFKNISYDELKAITKGVNVYSDLSPHQKGLIISHYEKEKNVVTYFGDGYSDIIAARRATVGVVPSNASQIAHNYSDLISLDKDIAHLPDSIKIGRWTFINSLKYIKITISTTLGFMLSLLISSIWFPFLPMTSNQLLIQTLLLDFVNLAFIFDRVDADALKNTAKWKKKSIIKFSLFNSIVPIIISMINLILVTYGFGWMDNFYNSSGQESIYWEKKIQTSFFIESFITKMFLFLIYRSEKTLFIKSKPSNKFLLLTFGGIFMIILLTLIPKVNDVFDLIVLEWYWWVILLGYVMLTFILAENAKRLYIKIFKYWF